MNKILVFVSTCAVLSLEAAPLVIEGVTNRVYCGETFSNEAGDAVKVVNSKNVSFEGCTFARSVGAGLVFGPGATRCSAVNCTFDDLGVGFAFAAGASHNRVVSNRLTRLTRYGFTVQDRASRNVAVGNLFRWSDLDAVLADPLPVNPVAVAAKDNFYENIGTERADMTPGFLKRKLRELPLATAPALARPATPWPYGTETSVTLANDYVTLVFDAKGRISSLKEKAFGRELIGTPTPFVTLTLSDNKTVLEPESMVGDARHLAFRFADGRSVWLAVHPYIGGWVFETVNHFPRLADVERVTMGRTNPVCAKEKGSVSGIVCDEKSAVVARTLQPDIEMFGKSSGEVADDERETFVFVRARYGFAGKRFGFAAGPAEGILDRLVEMAEVAGLRQSGCGGPMSMRSDINRSSYLLATWMDMSSSEDWLRLLDKAGCRMLHLHAWWLHRGQYEVNPMCFPGGMADMKKLVDRLHAEGKLASTHSLSAVTQFADAHIRPEWFDDYRSDADYTLARPYRRGDKELYVNECPAQFHARVLTGGTNGNILRLGDDLLQYADFSREKPYRFTGITIAKEPYLDAAIWDATQAMGAENAAIAEHANYVPRKLTREEYPAGTEVSYLHHRYGEFVAKPGSRLAEELTDRLAGIYNELGLDGIYFDGAEAMWSTYGTEWLALRTIQKMHPRNGTIINSISCRLPFNWWNRSLANTWDHPSYGPRSFHDRHIRVGAELTRADFLRTDLGWWNIHSANAVSRGYFPEELEYTGAKTTANDMTISLQGLSVSDRPLTFSADRQVTIFGKWERTRYARAMRPELLPAMKTRGRDFLLEQDDTGTWQLVDKTYLKHRVGSTDFAKWSLDSDRATPVAVRVEALWGVDRTASATNTIRNIDASMLADMKQASAKGVAFSAKASEDAAHGKTIRLVAKNESAPAKGAWASVRKEFDILKLFNVNPVSSLWIKGDGSGATLNVQVMSSPAYGGGCSENLVKLDFTGWRKIELLLRERDADESSTFDWPYENTAWLYNPVKIFMSPLAGDRICSLAYYLNGIEPGKTVDIELGDWDSLPVSQGTLAKGARLTVNGEKFTLPFALAGGDYVELKDGAWTHYAADGQPLEMRAASAMPTFRKGANAIAYEGRRTDGEFARAEVTFAVTGEKRAAYVPLTAEQKKLLNVEYEMPLVLNPTKGLDIDANVKVRPSETAALCFEILGPVKNPVVAGRRIPVTLKDAQDRVSSYDGKTWQAIRLTPGDCGPDNRNKPAIRTVLAEGTFAQPFARLMSGSNRLTVTADEAAGARVTFFKQY